MSHCIKRKKCQVTSRKELFYYQNVTSGSNVTCNVHGCVTVDYQQIENDNIANQIHGFTIDYGKFILIATIRYLLFAIRVFQMPLCHGFLLHLTQWTGQKRDYSWPNFAYPSLFYHFPTPLGEGGLVRAEHSTEQIHQACRKHYDAGPYTAGI